MLQSPQMIQAMQILQLSALELEDRIEQELVENPFLELAEPGGEGGQMSGEATPAEAAAQRETEALLENLERWDRDNGAPPRASSGGEDGDKKLEAMANTPDVQKSLAEALVDELAFLDLDARARELAEYLVWSLDERGYLPQTLDEIAADCMKPGEDGEPPLIGPDEPPVTAAELRAVLARVRSISHPALGAHDVRESLLAQLEAYAIDDPLLEAIVQNHLEDVHQNKLPRIAKETGRTIEEVKEALESLRTLEPNPGAGFGEARADVISPDVIVEEIEGEFVVRLDRARMPSLRLSPSYRELLKQAKKGDGVREWVKKRLESARWFLDAVAQRQSTLERIANSIFARQKGFLERGVSGLKPLRMQEVADEVHVHISTVSRAVAGKYAQTPRGIFPLKYFFTSGTQSETGELQSQQSLKQRIAELVAAEDPSNPLSDEDLAKQLEEKDHVTIARRTVTKYRKALSIPSSTQRKKF